MFLYIFYILRIFSETMSGISALLGFAMLFISCFLIAIVRRKTSASPDRLFFFFLLAYTLIHILGVGVACFKFGKIIFLPSFYAVLQMVFILALYQVVQSQIFLKQSRISHLLNFVTWLYVGVSLYNVVSVLIGKVSRAAWPCHHPNSLGFVLAILCAYQIIASSKSRLKKWFFCLALSAGLFATKSLSAIVVWLVILFLYSIFILKKKYVVLFIVIMGIFYAIVGRTFIADRLAELVYNVDYYQQLWTSKGVYTMANSFEFRIANWSGLFRQFLESPWIGHGTGSWMIINPLREYMGPLGGFHPHSETFAWLIQFGVLGSVVIFWMFIKSIFHYLKKAKRFYSYRTFGIIFPGLLIGALLGKALFSVLALAILILIYFTCEYEQSKEGGEVPNK